MGPRNPFGHRDFRSERETHAAGTGILSSMQLGRIAWLVTTIVCLVAAVVVLIDGYRGYAAVAFAVAISAAINLL